jgi:hypothetical protein
MDISFFRNTVFLIAASPPPCESAPMHLSPPDHKLVRIYESSFSVRDTYFFVCMNMSKLTKSINSYFDTM